MRSKQTTIPSAKKGKIMRIWKELANSAEKVIITLCDDESLIFIDHFYHDNPSYPTVDTYKFYDESKAVFNEIKDFKTLADFVEFARKEKARMEIGLPYYFMEYATS